MIVDSILQYFFDFIEWLALFLPVMKIPLSLFEGQASLWRVIHGVSCIMPVYTFLSLLGLIATIYVIEGTWAILNWLIAKIPTIN